MSKYKDMPDEFLRNNYVPDVYQKSIYAIDYEKLKLRGIKLISFDIDDTITGLENFNPPKAAITLFENLKKMGFTIVLLTNASEERAKRFSHVLGVTDYIARAQKPKTNSFQKVLNDFGNGLDKSEMAHVGNSISDDVAGGKVFGITTCLVRGVGKLAKVPGMLKKTEGQKLREELKSRKIWRKHHKYQDNDQYYQFGETPVYCND